MSAASPPHFGRLCGALSAAACGSLAALGALAMAKKKHLRGARGALWAALDGADRPSQPVPCGLCAGSGRFPCKPCKGRGSLPRGGFAKRNPVKLDGLVGSQWTAVQAIEGKWRHFRCVGKRGKSSKDTVVVLAGACGPKQRRRVVEISVAELKRRDLWASGWTTMDDLARADQEGGVIGTKCISCSGDGHVPCPRCDGIGQVGLSGW
jgi:tryptophan-rich hypothetical protein